MNICIIRPVHLVVETQLIGQAEVDELPFGRAPAMKRNPVYRSYECRRSDCRRLYMRTRRCYDRQAIGKFGKLPLSLGMPTMAHVTLKTPHLIRLITIKLCSQHTMIISANNFAGLDRVR